MTEQKKPLAGQIDPDRALAERRAAPHNVAAALTQGPMEVLDFMLPLFAGGMLGASPAQVGLLAGTETLVSLLARPIAGHAADRGNRLRLAGFGAALYGLSLLGYALTPSVLPAYLAAVLGGIGGAVFWVSLRSALAERSASDHAVFARLLESEGSGSWIAFVVAIPVAGALGYQAVFALGAVSCFAAAIALGRASGRERAATLADLTGNGPPAVISASGLTQKLRPILLLVAGVAFAESAVGLLLLFLLQREHQLQLGEIAMVFLPGFIVFTTAPGMMHRLVRRYGRRGMLIVAYVCSAVFAAALSLAPDPIVLAALWVLSAACWAVTIPVQQGVIAELSADMPGRGFGRYESAELLGATAGLVLAGVSYPLPGGWLLACLSCAAVLVAAAVAAPFALRSRMVANLPGAEPSTAEAPTVQAAETSLGHAAETPSVHVAETLSGPKTEPGTEGPSATSSRDSTPKLKNRGKSYMRNWLIHTAIFVIAQIVFASTAVSWPWEVLQGNLPPTSILSSSGENPGIWPHTSRIWTIVWIVDTIWTLASGGRRSGRGAGEGGSSPRGAGRG
ncbi:MFS transporter [Saxibacter everestensis]|uniref:MFS transporter n=1 Tax=Saxibacter everestensis TaxID=2909229 RepID=A0ABY8QYZ0_9MICO|nr:MFS transporter [Brevibacteriaceae bacterium ZFBP1038]